jgi:hypothetical protein
MCGIRLQADYGRLKPAAIVLKPALGVCQAQTQWLAAKSG